MIQPHINKNETEVVLNNINIYEVKTVSDIFSLQYNLETNTFDWKKVGKLNVPLAYHATEYLPALNSIIVFGGISIDNSSVLNGERQTCDPVIVSLTDFTSTHKLVSNMILDTPRLSGMSSFQVS